MQGIEDKQDIHVKYVMHCMLPQLGDKSIGSVDAV